MLYVYRPFKSADGEPEIVVLEIDKDEKSLKGATPKSMKGAQIIEIGGGNNSLCKTVVKWLKQNMGQYFNGAEVESGTTDGQVDPAHVVEKLLGILDPDKIKENYQTMLLKLANTFAKADDDEPLLGVRKGRIEWFKITKESTDPKEPDETKNQQTAVYPEVTAFDKWFNRQLFTSVEISQGHQRVLRQAETGPVARYHCHVGPHRALTLHEEDILKHLYGEVDWNNKKK